MTVIDYSAEDRYYHHTGRAPLIGTTFAALTAWLAAIILGVGYAYADMYGKVHEVLVVVMVILFGVGGGFAVLMVLRWGKVRNLTVATLIAVSAAILLFYVAWVAWEAEVLRRNGMPSSPFFFFRRPDIVWRFARRLNRVGTFTYDGSDVKGVWLWLLWVGEAILLIGGTIAIPVRLHRHLAFCEACGTWCRSNKDIVRVQHFDEELVREHMEEKDFEYLIRLGPANKLTPVHFKVDLLNCPKCGQTNLLTVSRINVSYYNGKPIETAKKVVDRLWIDAPQADAVRALPKQLLAKAQVAPAEATATTSPPDSPAAAT